jgi:non-specific serine/threonine protein kinase
LTELPDKNEIDSFCTMLPEQENLYLNILQSQKKELFNVIEDKGLGRSQINILSALLKLRQTCCHPRLLKISNPIHSAKFDLFKELLQEIIDDGHKVVVFTQFVQMLQIIKKHLDEHNHSYSYLDGSTKKRQTVIEDFNRDEKKQIFLCSLKAGGVGINLTAANYVILYDPWWNPAVEQQAMDRVHRLGQQKKVFVYKLITKGTVEEKIMRLKARKKDLLSSVIDQEKEFTKSITREELEKLFSY